MSADDLPAFDEPIGLFPLPNVVLLPEGTLPLQVFEPRYRAMVRDALVGDALIAMALLKPGFEPYYYTNLAEIHEIVCVGRIAEHVKLQDGRYFINLHGLCRARLQEENREGEYRQAILEPLVFADSGIDTDGEYAARALCRQLLDAPEFESLEGIGKLRVFVDSGASLTKIVDKLGSNLLLPTAVEIKQRLLEEMDVLERARTLLSELRVIQQTLELRQRSVSQWPHVGGLN